MGDGYFYFPFVCADWMSDPQLSMCSPATRGFWVDAICAMFANHRTGEVSGTPEQLARVCRCKPAEATAAIADLRRTKAADVTDRNGIVTLVCRRMKREYDKRKSNNERQKKHRSRRVTNDVPGLSQRNGHHITNTRASDLELELKSDPEPPNPQPSAGGSVVESKELSKEEIWRRVCIVVRRDPIKPRSESETTALTNLSGVTEAEMAAVEWYAERYRSEPTKFVKPRGLAHTLLAEFHAEVGKANSARKRKCDSPVKEGGVPSDWPEFLAHFAALHPSQKEKILQWKSWSEAERDTRAVRAAYETWKAGRRGQQI